MDIYEEIALFFNEPIERVREKCSEAHNRLNQLWRQESPSSEEKRILWYRTTDAHIYEGANWHNMHLEVRKRIAELAYGKILCFGAGIGTEGIMAVEMGKDVCFYELRSLIADFLKFRVKLRDLKNVKFIDKELEKKEKNHAIYFESDAFDIYDTIICIDVLEHLDYPQETLNFLSRYLKSEGLFLVSSPFSELEYLGHLSQNRFFDIDMMMKIANIKNYRKEILRLEKDIGMTPPPVKIFLLNILSVLPIKNLLKHRIIYLLASIKKKITKFFIT